MKCGYTDLHSTVLKKCIAETVGAMTRKGQHRTSAIVIEQGKNGGGGGECERMEAGSQEIHYNNKPIRSIPVPLYTLDSVCWGLNRGSVHARNMFLH